MAEKVELLAPAGDYEGLIGALHAGADAVYLGGDKFGARAYAGNFDSEQILRGIRHAHLFGRKVYLTVNTLVKEKEFDELYAYLVPPYEAGLDGVIVQDIGVLGWITKQFPQLAVHASTQMNISHAYGAQFLKDHGVVRVVPARELSIHEIRQIREQVNIELETFIHGAMCYSYSGQCLFSSILGTRSGNRGRCAQPCRLPYRKSGDGKTANWYPLSLKDMCTVKILPDLIEAGIHAFKIEGRMKKPEYAAGVTAVYRKYIDLYYEKGRSGFAVAEEDLQYLQSLYIRDEAGEGYYYRHNGRDMITCGDPGYEGGNEALLKEIRRRYIDTPMNIAINGHGNLTLGQPSGLTVSYDRTTVTVKGETVQPAMKQPLTEEAVARQLQKSGNTFFVFKELNITMSDHIFMAVKELNELRRQALSRLEETLLRPFKRTVPPRLLRTNASKSSKTAAEAASHTLDEQKPGNDLTDSAIGAFPHAYDRQEYHVLVATAEQWASAVRHKSKRIYVDIDIWDSPDMPPKAGGMEWFAVLPRIFRLQSEQYLTRYADILQAYPCDGVLIQNVESYEWLRSIGYTGRIVTDTSLYIWNQEAWRFWQEKTNECYLPPELNEHEIKDMTGQYPEACGMVVYGRIPMMVSANCIWKTGQADPNRQDDILSLTDRYGKQFWVRRKCLHCYNVIYNTVPLSLHDSVRQGKLQGIPSLRLDFTTETGREAGDVIGYFSDISRGRSDAVRPYEQYTTGHSKRGVE